MDPPTSLTCLTVTYNVNQFRINQPFTPFLNPISWPKAKETGTTTTTITTAAFEVFPSFETENNDPDIIAIALQEVSGAGYFIESTSSSLSESVPFNPTSPLLPTTSTDSSTTTTTESMTCSSSWFRSCLLEPEDIEYWKTKVLQDFNLEPSLSSSSSSSSSDKAHFDYNTNPSVAALFPTIDSTPLPVLEPSVSFQPQSQTKNLSSLENEKMRQRKKKRYQLLKYTGIGGLLLLILAEKELLPWFQEIETSLCIVGPLGFPNKGAVGISFQFTPLLSLCFINVHLSAGNGLRMNTYRTSQLQFILQHLSFASSSSSTAFQVLNHDMVFLMGDFNFRLSFPSPSSFPFPPVSDTTSSKSCTPTSSIDHDFNYVSWDSFTPLLPIILPSFNELPIQFEPTYKWLPTRILSSSSSPLSLQASLVPTRVPGYTDRICFYINSESTWRLTPLRYTAFPSFIQSDHRPVVAYFHLKCTSTSPSSYSSSRVASRGLTSQVTSLQSWNSFLPSRMPFVWICLLRHRYAFLTGLSIFIFGSVIWFNSNKIGGLLTLPWK